MSKQYRYRFRGTYAEFASQVFFPVHQQPLEFDGYQLKRDENGLLQFGVNRAGHGAGIWYEHTVRQVDGELVFAGELVCKRYDGTIVEDSPMTWKDRIGYGIFAIVCSPIILIVWIYSLFRLDFAQSSEDRLDRLMTERFHCEKIK